MAMNDYVISQGSVKSGAETHRHLADRRPGAAGARPSAWPAPHVAAAAAGATPVTPVQAPLGSGNPVDALARSRSAGELHNPACADRIALSRLARRYRMLDEVIRETAGRSGRRSHRVPHAWSPCRASAPAPPGSY